MDFPTGKYSLPQILFGLALSNTLLEISSDNDVLALSDIVAKIFLLYILSRSKFGLPFIFQTEEEGSEVESVVIVTDDSDSNSSSSAVRTAEPEMKQGKCKVL